MVIQLMNCLQTPFMIVLTIGTVANRRHSNFGSHYQMTMSV